jgi:hypothetical protein
MLNPQLTLRPIRSAEESPIFVIGSGRSGTTLLRQMLNAHPRIYIAHEAGFYSYARHAARSASLEAWLERFFETYSFAWMRLDPQQVRAALPADLTMDRLSEVFTVLMQQKARQQGKVRYGEKNPLDTHNLPRIFADFPDARVVFIMRDPRPTVHAFNRMPFGTSSTLINTFLCRVQYDHIRPFLDRILEVRLEDLSTDPRATMASILNYLGEPFDKAVLDHVTHAQADDVPALPWFGKATRQGPSQRASSGEARDPLTPAWIRLIERLNRESMQRYGYAPATLPAEPSVWEYARALAGDARGMFASAYRLYGLNRLLDRHFQGIERLDPQRGLEENLKLNPAAWRYYPSFEMPQVPPLPELDDAEGSPG